MWRINPTENSLLHVNNMYQFLSCRLCNWITYFPSVMPYGGAIQKKKKINSQHKQWYTF